MKTYDEEELFTFDLHAGAFETIEETEELQNKLEELGIEDTEVSSYDEIEKNMELYDKKMEETEVVFENTAGSLPENISEDVKICIRQFPVNKDFQIQTIGIWDLENSRKNKYKDTPNIPGIDEKTKAYSYALYRDDLFGKDITVMLFNGEKGAYKKLFIEESENKGILEGAEFIGNIDFQTAEGKIDCKLYSTKTDFIINGTNQDKSFQLFMRAYNFTLNQFNEFLNNCYSDSSYLVYPQLRKSLFILPVENKFVHRDFIYFSLNKVDMSYAKERGYADWAMAIVGHWESESIYYQDGKLFSTEFFDLEYNYNAQKIHSLFMKAHENEIINELNHSTNIKSVKGWFILIPYNGSDELSFATKSYIIAVDSYTKTGMLCLQELTEVAKDLQIWD